MDSRTAEQIYDFLPQKTKFHPISIEQLRSSENMGSKVN